MGATNYTKIWGGRQTPAPKIPNRLDRADLHVNVEYRSALLEDLGRLNGCDGYDQSNFGEQLYERIVDLGGTAAHQWLGNSEEHDWASFVQVGAGFYRNGELVALEVAGEGYTDRQTWTCFAAEAIHRGSGLTMHVCPSFRASLYAPGDFPMVVLSRSQSWLWLSEQLRFDCDNHANSVKRFEPRFGIEGRLLDSANFDPHDAKAGGAAQVFTPERRKTS